MDFATWQKRAHNTGVLGKEKCFCPFPPILQPLFGPAIELLLLLF